MRLSLLVFLLLGVLLLPAQDDLVAEDAGAEYLDSFLKSCKKRHAEYIRRIEENGVGRFMATTVSVYGDTVFIGEYSDPSCTTPHGRFAYFHENGKLESKGRYSSGRKVGMWKYWKKDGTPKPSVKYAMAVPEEMIAEEKREIAQAKEEQANEAQENEQQTANAEAIKAAEEAMAAAKEAESEALEEVASQTQGDGETSETVEQVNYSTGTVGSAAKKATPKGQEPNELNRANATPLKTNSVKLPHFGLPVVW